jgi:Glutaminase
MERFSPLFNRLWIPLLGYGLLFLTACNDNGGKTTANTTDTARAQPDKPAPAATDTSLLTIAGINEAADGKNMEIRFYERAAVYTIDKNDKLFSGNSSMLREALTANIPIKLLSNPLTNRIANFVKASEAEVKAYNSGDGFNSVATKIKAAAAERIDLSKIDTGTFNRVDKPSKFPVFRLCSNVVPNYATLVTIFNYCASQGCNKPGPYAIPNCIPFQYVVDGCYARAHKMRQMIMAQYGYCCEKVFSYGEYPSTLAVKADKWGGCCIKWWYHVAPLLRVNIKLGARTLQLAYVIDPGMFNAPVTLSTWLNAQKNAACASNANVTSYSIQPGTAYWPMNGGYGTDPNYALTEQKLLQYKNLVTCN